MSNPFDVQANSITPPVQAKNLYVLAVTGTSQWITVPTAWAGKYITLRPRGGTLYYAFKYNATPTVDETAESTVSGNAITAFHGNEAAEVLDGGEKHLDMRNLTITPEMGMTQGDTLKFAYKGSTTLRLEVVVSSGKVTPGDAA